VLFLLHEAFSEGELPLDDLSLEAEFDDECWWVTTAGAGATITGAGWTIATAGAVAAVTVSLWWLSELWLTLSAPALPMTTLPNSTTTPKDNAAVFSLLFVMTTTPCEGSA
jgi:hypothetical protein